MMLAALFFDVKFELIQESSEIDTAKVEHSLLTIRVTMSCFYYSTLSVFSD